MLYNGSANLKFNFVNIANFNPSDYFSYYYILNQIKICKNMVDAINILLVSCSHFDLQK